MNLTAPKVPRRPGPPTMFLEMKAEIDCRQDKRVLLSNKYNSGKACTRPWPGTKRLRCYFGINQLKIAWRATMAFLCGLRLRIENGVNPSIFNFAHGIS
jgi:hypothetical protein